MRDDDALANTPASWDVQRATIETGESALAISDCSLDDDAVSHDSLLWEIVVSVMSLITCTNIVQPGGSVKRNRRPGVTFFLARFLNVARPVPAERFFTFFFFTFAGGHYHNNEVLW